jgi:ATP-dependent exoDNAse (exonuclease V) alpha subunit
MALYHHKPKVIRRRKGHSSVASAAYCRGINLKDARTGKIHRYSHKTEVVHSEIILPKDAPEWITKIAVLERTHPNKAASLLWNSVEKKEIRKDAQLARIITIALPIELNQEQCTDLTRRYVQAAYCDQGMVADFSIHWENGNPHAHLLLSMRFLEKNGWGKKERDWNRRSLNLENRKILADITNDYLKTAGFDITVSHLSYAARGIDLEPTIHEGNKDNLANQQARTRNKEIRLKNLQDIMDDPEILLDKLSKEKPTFTLEDIANTLGTQLEPANQGVLSPSPLPPNIPRQRIASHVKNFFNAAAPQWLQSVPAAEPVIAAQATLQEVARLKIELSPEASVQQIAAEVLAKITQHESVFTERHLASILSQHVANPTEVATALLQIKTSPQLMAIGFGEDGRERYTTREMFDLENNLQELAEKLNAKASHQVNGRLINHCLKAFNLEHDQAKAIRYLLKGNDISMLVGRAGTGKSYALKAAKAAWEQSGYTVYGVTLAGVAAENLEQDSDIKSSTIDSFMGVLASEKLSLTSKSIIVMDEAGMTDAFSMAKVMTAVWKARAKLVLVGDDAQLQPIGPGAIFRALLERVGFTELTTVKRQSEPWQREATLHFAAGKTLKALEYYERHHCLHLKDTASLARASLIEDWYASVQASSLVDNLILSAFNPDVKQLNQLARQKIAAAGKLLGRYFVVTKQGKLEIALGERLLFLENSWRYKVKNGSRGTITHIECNAANEVQNIQVQLDGRQNKIISFNPAHYKKFDYGYAATVHRAQGLTVNHSFVYTSRYWDKILSYVAMTRHRHSAQLYADKETYPTLDKLKKRLSKWSMKDSLLDYPLAFALRRGIDPENSLAALQKHLSEKLQWMAESLKNNFEQTFFPQRYWEKKSQNAEKQQSIQELLQRREDASLVAVYADADQAVRIAWRVIESRKQILELKDDVDFKEIALALKDEPCLKIFKEAQVKRDELSHQIYQAHGSYTKALEIYDIALEKLREESSQHERRQNIAHYLTELAQGRIIYRDRLAFIIQQEIKEYYPSLLDNNVDLSLLKAHANAHQRRAILTKLSSEERQDFRIVENYIALSKKSAALWQQITKQEQALKSSLLMTIDDLSAYQINRLQTLAKTGTPLKREVLHQAEETNHARDALASQITKDLPCYKKALDFYEFGQLKSVHETPSPFEEKAAVWAKERLERLEIQANRFKLKTESAEQIKEYLRLLNQSNDCRYELADQIIHHKQIYYPAIFELAPELRNLFRNLHQDAKFYQRLQLLKDFSAEERLAFLAVERYVEQRRTLWKIWTETKDIPTPHHPIVQEIEKNHFIARDVLAFAIVQEPSLYQKALTFFNIKIEHLNKSAFYHQVRQDCTAFKKAVGNLNARLELAKKITCHRGAYTVVKEDSALSWHQLQNYADFAIKKERIAALSLLEQADYRTALKYKKLRREAGKLWGNIFSQKQAGLDVSVEQFEQAIAMNAERNALAFDMKENRIRFDEFLFSAQVQAKDIPKHATTHENTLQKQKEIERIRSLVSTNPELLNSSKAYQEATKQYWDINTVIDTLAHRAETFAMNLLGSPIAKTSTATTYRYGSNKGSLNVTVRGEKAGLWYDFATEEGGNFISLIRRELHLDFTNALQYAAEWANIAPASSLIKQKPKIERQVHLKSNKFTETQLEKIIYAREIVAKSTPLAGTLAERYLTEHRGITDPALNINFRFNPSVKEPETKQYWPVLVAIAKNRQDEVQAVQCIYLDPKTANKLNVKVPKRSFGPQEGAAVLVQKAQYILNVGYQYALAEGPETALSVAHSDKNLGVYVTLSVSNFGNIPISSAIKDILLCADNDGINADSNKALQNAIEILSERGLNVSVAKPLDCKDFNDVLLKHGESEVKRLIDHKTLVKKALTLEQLIENKETLVSDDAKIVVEFETKFREHKNLGEPQSKEEVEKKTALFEHIGKLATYIQDNTILKETVQRYKIDREASYTQLNYVKYKKWEAESKSLIQEVKSTDPIKDYLTTIEQQNKLTPPWITKLASEKEQWYFLNEQAQKLAFIIDKRLSTQYAAKEMGIYEKVKKHSFEWQDVIEKRLSLELGIGIGR